jgi:hypothetical protein
MPEPGYGGVRPLCKALGYASENPMSKDSRAYCNLSRKTAAYRKKFITNLGPQPLGVGFLTDYASLEAQKCAIGFLEGHKELFAVPPDPQQQLNPSLPRDRKP